MTSQQRPSQLALSALLLCTLVRQTAGHHGSSSLASLSSSTSLSEMKGRISEGTGLIWLRQSLVSRDRESRPPANIQDISDQANGPSVSPSPNHNATVTTDRFVSPRPDEGVSPICAYRVIEEGIWGQLCFRHTLFGYKCHKADCGTEVSFGNLVANLLLNGSVLLQWTGEEDSTMTGRNNETKEITAGQTRSRDLGTNVTPEETSPSSAVFGERRHRRRGFELSCWWNGTYTQFECASVHLGSGCRDFLLIELHENIPYRFCLRSLVGSDSDKRADRRDCVEFKLPPSGMQDVVIAMTTVGGAICVMLVVICLLVAYITENLMRPTTHHTYSYCTHSRH